MGYTVDVFQLSKPWYDMDIEAEDVAVGISCPDEYAMIEQVRTYLSRVGGLHDGWIEVHAQVSDLPPKPEGY